MNKNAIKRINNTFWTVLDNYNKVPSFYQLVDDEEFLFYGILNAGLTGIKKNEIIDYKNSLSKDKNTIFNKVVLRLCLFEYGLNRVNDKKPAIDYVVSEYYKKRLDADFVHPLETEYYRRIVFKQKDENFSEIIGKIEKCREAKDAKELLAIIKDITAIYKVSFNFSKLFNADLSNYIGYEEKFENDILDLAMNENIFSAEFTFNTNQEEFASEYKEEEKKKLRRENIVYTESEKDIQKKFGDMIRYGDEIMALEQKYCKGMHENCKLYFTDGAIEGVVGENHLAELNAQIDFNKTSFENDKKLIDTQINKLKSGLKEYFNRREELFKKNRGRLDAKMAYKGTYLNSVNIFKNRNIEVKKPFICEILIDGSGSLDNKQANVSELAYIISEAFNKTGVRTRVSAYSNYVDYTIFREYKSYKSTDNEPIKNYYATGMNRDSLALSVATDSLLRHPEKKLIIYINDGYPNDINITKQHGLSRKDYAEKFAYDDIKASLKDLRKTGVSIISIYVGGSKRVKIASSIYGENMISLNRMSEISTELLKKINKIM